MVGDKTGNGGYGTRNDIAVVWPPGGDPVVLAVLSSRDQDGAEHNDQLIADAAAVVVNALAEAPTDRPWRGDDAPALAAVDRGYPACGLHPILGAAPNSNHAHQARTDDGDEPAGHPGRAVT